MIITAFRALTREYVIEYNPDASWASWQFYREDSDTMLYMGKLEIIVTKFWKTQRRLAKTLFIVGLSSAAAAAASYAGPELASYLFNGGCFNCPQ